MPDTALTIGVHLSGLARAQAEVVAHRLADRKISHSVHLEVLEDTNPSTADAHDDHIAENRAKIHHLHEMLRGGEVDVVAHRGFDLRGVIPDGLQLGAVLERFNPYDALVSPDDICFDELDSGARVGVVQLRARAQLLAYRSDLEYELILGDVENWLTALIDGRIEALVAPGAALEHLGLQERVSEIFPPELLVPAPGSGILICLCREGDELTRERLRCLHDASAAREYTAECSLMEALDSGWERPIGVLAQSRGSDLALTAVAASADGQRICREDHVTDGTDPCRAGTEVAALMLESGVYEILEKPDHAMLSGHRANESDIDEAQWDDEADADILDIAVSIEDIEREEPDCD